MYVKMHKVCRVRGVVTLGALCAQSWSRTESEETLAEHTGRPKYLELADTLRRAIASGQYQVGGELPSTAQLTTSFDVSTTVVRGAIRELRSEGLVVGQPGKAVYVRATPDKQPAAPVEEQLRELSALVHRALEDIESRLTALERDRRD